jgi:hypothetical protein
MQIPRSWDFTQDAKYDQTNRIDHDGWFITGWYDTGRVLPQKWWDFISVFANNLSANQKIRVYYQLSDGEETDNENLAEDGSSRMKSPAATTQHHHPGRDGAAHPLPVHAYGQR